jgi:ABC-2 type transport system ATP-binding protein
MSIILKQIRKNFLAARGMKEVLKNVTFSVPPGSLFALTGKNGAGKTTLLKILATLVLPDGGEAFIGNRNVLEEPLEVKRQLGLVFDTERCFYQVMTAEDNLRFYAALFNVTGSRYRQRRDLLSAALGLSGWLATPVNHCSSGVKQKLAVARALLPDPGVILIDELSRSLDPDAERQVSLFLRELVVKHNRTALVATHDRHWADEYADEQWHLENGVADRVLP